MWSDSGIATDAGSSARPASTAASSASVAPSRSDRPSTPRIAVSSSRVRGGRLHDRRSARGRRARSGAARRASAAVRSRHAPTCCATPRDRPRSWRAPFMRHHASSGSGRVRTRRRRSSHSSIAHSSRPIGSSRATSTSCSASRCSTSAAAYTRCSACSGRRVQSVRRSPFVSRTSSSRSTSDASDGAPSPMKPAATCVSNSFDGPRPHARARIARSCSAACATISAGPAEDRRRTASMSTANGSIERDPARPRDLHEREARPVRALAVELGVERVARLVAELVDQAGERRRRRRPSAAPCACAPDALQAVVTRRYAARPRRTAPRRSNDASTSSWSSARWRMITSVQPARAEVGERVARRARCRRRPAPRDRSRGSRRSTIGPATRCASASSAPTWTSRRTAIVAGVRP